MGDTQEFKELRPSDAAAPDAHLVSADRLPTDWDAIERVAAPLLKRSVGSAAELEWWLADLSEVTAWVEEAGVRREVAAMAQTDDAYANRHHLEWVREVAPRWKRLEFEFIQTYLRHPQRRALPQRYLTFDRTFESRHALYREDNLPLLVAEAEKIQAYRKILGAAGVAYRGREYSRSQARAFLSSPDRRERETVWRLMNDRMLAAADALDGVFDELFQLRGAIARNAQCPCYREYAFRVRRRFDYGPAQCAAFRDAVAEHFAPLLGRIARERCRAMGVNVLRPWDILADPLGREAPRLPSTSEAFLDRCETAAGRVAPEFARCLRDLRDGQRIDIAPRKGKAPGSWEFLLPLTRTCFIMINTHPAEQVRVLFHELGHAVHIDLMRNEPLVWYREPTEEITEIASKTMELFALLNLDCIYEAPGDARRAYRDLLEIIVVSVPWIAAIDEFQEWTYAHPNKSVADRRDAWRRVYRRYHPDWVDWSGHDDALGCAWHLQPHIFIHPFYFIEYGLAEIVALNLWCRATGGDPAGALDAYRAALSLGGSRPLPDVYQAAGVPFRFDATVVGPAAAAIGAALDQVPYL